MLICPPAERVMRGPEDIAEMTCFKETLSIRLQVFLLSKKRLKDLMPFCTFSLADVLIVVIAGECFWEGKVALF